MVVWRLTLGRHLETAFSGEGARRVGGRWNSPGRPVVYTSSTLALAALEMLVHLDEPDLPADLFAVPATLPDGIAVRKLDEKHLPRAWRSVPIPAKCRALGDAWLAAGETAVLSVPSVVVPQECNFLLNPAHPDFPRILLGRSSRFGLDPRLKHPSGRKTVEK